MSLPLRFFAQISIVITIKFNIYTGVKLNKMYNIKQKLKMKNKNKKLQYYPRKN